MTTVTEKWIGGALTNLTWSPAFGTEVNSLVNGNAVASTISVTNGSSLDIFADFSITSATAISSGPPNYVGLYLYPLAADGATYGDGRFGSSAAGPPPSNYYKGAIGFLATTSCTVYGVLTHIVIPPGTFEFVLYNQAAATLSSTVTCKYRSYDRSTG